MAGPGAVVWVVKSKHDPPFHVSIFVNAVWFSTAVYLVSRQVRRRSRGRAYLRLSGLKIETDTEVFFVSNGSPAEAEEVDLYQRSFPSLLLHLLDILCYYLSAMYVCNTRFFFVQERCAHPSMLFSVRARYEAVGRLHRSWAQKTFACSCEYSVHY